MGFNFLNLEVSRLKSGPPDSNESEYDGLLHYKYVPRTGHWGTPDVEYTVISPAANPNRKILEQFVGSGQFKWNVARWEDMPTQYTIINTLADLEIKEFTSGSLKRTIGDHDLSQINQKILE